MKTDALFLDLEKRNNIYLYKETNSDIVNQFEEKYLKFKDKFSMNNLLTLEEL